MATFVSDSFSDTDGTALENHTGETGATWTPHPSGTDTMRITSGRLYLDGTNDGIYYASGVPESADYDVEATFTIIGTTADIAPRIAGRMDTAGLTYYMAGYSQFADQWDLFKFVGGAPTMLGSWPEALGVGSVRTARLEMRGTSIKLYVDGVERISATDGDVTAAGRAGLDVRGTGSATNGVHLDNFTATDAVTSVTLSPGAASLTLTGQTPTVQTTADVTLSPGAASLSLAGQAPTVATTADVRLQPGASSLTLAGGAPTVDATAHVTLTPGPASLTLAGQTPAVQATANRTVTPLSASLTLSGQAPTVTTTGDQTVQAGSASLSLSGNTPTVRAPYTVQAGAGALTLTTAAPSLDTRVPVGAASLTLSGLVPVVRAPRTVQAGAASLSLTGGRPIVATTTDVPVRAEDTCAVAARVTTHTAAARTTVLTAAPRTTTYATD